MKEHAEEAQARKRGATQADEEAAVLAKIAGFADSDRVMAERVHALVKANAPSLSCRLWYGMPACTKNGKVLMHFQDAGKFKMRYATLGFSDEASLDDGTMWPNAFALKKLTKADEARIAEPARGERSAESTRLDTRPVSRRGSVFLAVVVGALLGAGGCSATSDEAMLLQRPRRP